LRPVLATLSALLALPGCSDSFRSESEWTYSPSPRHPIASLALNDPERSSFVGLCAYPNRPSFALLGGRHDPDALTYDVEVDGRIWHVTRENIPHDGPSLDFSDPEIVKAIAQARKHITISEGRWRRTLPVSPLLARFLSDCRKVHDRLSESGGLDREASATAINLDDLLIFETPHECIEGPALAQLLGSMLVTTEDDRLVRGTPSVPAAYRAALGPMFVDTVSGVRHATLGLTGDWHGLPVKSLLRYAVEESDYGGFEIRFNASRDRLLTTVNAIGFDLPESGERVIGDEVATTITISGDERSATLTCHVG